MSNSQQRTRQVNLNIAASLLIKGWMGLVQLALIPATLHCLGSYANGVWLTIAAMLVWIDSMDIGLGNGLRGEVSVSVARGQLQQARESISSVMVMLLLVVVPLTLSLLAAISWANVFSLFNAAPDALPTLPRVLQATVVIVGATFVMKSVGNVYMGMQMIAVSNALVALGQTLQLLAVVALDLLGHHSLLAVALASTLAPLTVYLIALPITFQKVFPQLRPALHLFRWQRVRSLLTTGSKFFVIQISGLVFMSASTLLISRLFTPVQVTPYQAAFRYTSLALVVYTIIVAPYWNSTADAFARRDMVWIRAAERRLMRMLLAVAILLAAMNAVAPWIYNLWVPDVASQALQLSWPLTAYIIVVSYQVAYSYLLNGMGRLKWQVVANVAAAIIFVPLCLLLHRTTHLGITAIIIAMTLANIPIAIVNRWQYAKAIATHSPSL